MLGKWSGVSAFSLVTLAIGLALAVGLAAYLDVNVDGEALTVSAARTIGSVVLFGGIATALAGHRRSSGVRRSILRCSVGASLKRSATPVSTS